MSVLVSGPLEPETPRPPEILQPTLISLAAGTPLHRVHLSRYEGCQFNPGLHGNARFSPITDPAGRPVPTLYAGTTLDCALMETVFHDVPHSTGFKSLDRSKLQDQVHSTVEVRQDLLLADLSSVALRRLGVTRRQLIDTDKDSYPMTRLWASAIHRACPEAQGLIWVSRQDDTARAVVLFGDRIAEGVILAERGSRSLLEDDIAFTAVLDLADRLGVCIVPSGR